MSCSASAELHGTEFCTDSVTGDAMGDDLHIITSQAGPYLHIVLLGTLNEEGVPTLARVLEQNMDSATTAIINTNCLEGIHPDCGRLLKENLGAECRLFSRLIVTGQNAQSLAPAGAMLFFA